MQYRKHGFTQRKPVEPGVYYVDSQNPRPGRFAPSRNAEGWDVACVMYWAGSYTNAYENRESVAHWRIKCLDGIEYAWKPGMWLKGPIRP